MTLWLEMLIFSSDLVNQNILYSLWRKVKCLSFHPKLLESDEFHLQRPISFHWPKESKPPGSGMDINMSEKHRVECSLPLVEIFWQWDLTNYLASEEAGGVWEPWNPLANAQWNSYSHLNIQNIHFYICIMIWSLLCKGPFLERIQLKQMF